MIDSTNPNVAIEISKIYTHKHIVSHYINMMATELISRGIDHDNSKLTPEELEGYVKHGQVLANATIGTTEYDDALKLMEEYNQIHYSRNRHHPEHYENGINDMSLIDIMEMFADWCAVSDYKNTDVVEVMKNTLFERFGIEEQLARIIINTLGYLRTKADPLNKEMDK